mgnify:FL=1
MKKECLADRSFWLGMLVSSVVGMFEKVVTCLPIIMCFQSLILDMAGNVGTQSLAVTIRVLMDETLTGRQKAELVLKEMRIGLCNGGLLGILSFVLIGLYIFLFKGKNTRICLCGIRLYRIIPAGGHAGIQCSGNLHTAVFQKGWCGPGSSLRSSDHYGK